MELPETRMRARDIVTGGALGHGRSHVADCAHTARHRRPPVARRDVDGLVADTITFSGADGPGNRFVVLLQGCNFDCIACHQPRTIPGNADPAELRPIRRTVGELVDAIRREAPSVCGVTVSGGEATRQAHFVHALLGELRSDPALGRLTALVDSNGACPSSVWDRLRPVFDGAMIDLKCLDPVVHHRLTGQSNALVLASIRHLHRLGRLHEVRLLVVPGLNDDPDLLRRTGEWLASVDPTMRVRVIGTRP